MSESRALTTTGKEPQLPVTRHHSTVPGLEDLTLEEDLLLGR